MGMKIMNVIQRLRESYILSCNQISSPSIFILLLYFVFSLAATLQHHTTLDYYSTCIFFLCVFVLLYTNSLYTTIRVLYRIHTLALSLDLLSCALPVQYANSLNPRCHQRPNICRCAAAAHSPRYR